jgi:hypothetical protein
MDTPSYADSFLSRLAANRMIRNKANRQSRYSPLSKVKKSKL